MKRGQIFKCVNCGGMARYQSGNQKYCLSCSEIKDKERKQKWRQSHPRIDKPLSKEEIARRRDREKVRKKSGIKLNDQAKKSITWLASSDPDIKQLIRFAIPFDQSLSKNAIYTMARGANYIFISNKHRKLRENIIAHIKRSIRSAKSVFYQGKIWIDILVQKPSHRGDAVNVIDAVCDSVKKAIDVDDNWFSIRRLDWEIVKNNPQIFIGVAQEVTEHHRVCSYCGRILSLISFGKRKHDKLGHARVCKECSRIDDSIRRKLKKGSS